MSTLADRIRWILATRNISQSELSRRADLDRQHVNQILKRLERNPESDVEGRTLAKLASGGGVGLSWLVTGEGHPELPTAEGRGSRMEGRPWWRAARDAAVRLRDPDELEVDDIDAVGRLPDDELEFPGELDGHAVLKVAAGLRRLRRRAATKR